MTSLAIEHYIVDAIDRPVEGNVDQPPRSGIQRRVPSSSKSLCPWCTAQPIGSGIRHADATRGLRHHAAIGQRADKSALPFRCPAVLAALAQDRDPVIGVGVVAVGIEIGIVGSGVSLGGVSVCHERQNNLFG